MEESKHQSYKSYAIKTAKQLGYSKAFIEKLKAVEDPNDTITIERIMVDARHERFDKFN